MTSIRIFEPALCCNTGVCGPELDQTLVSFTADLNALKEQGVDIVRANLASDPAAFAQNPAVVAFLKAAGSEGLPLVLVDDVTVMTGRYPSRDELLRFAGTAEAVQTEKAKGCCCGESATESATTSETCCGDATPADRIELPLAGGCCGGSASSEGCC